MITSVIRAAIVGLGALSVIGGFAGIAAGGELIAAGLWGVAFGLALILFVMFERGRYRSSTAERESSPAGPGGGELGGKPVEARFRRTDEVFIDPSSGHRMRVLNDPATGERRYVAED